MTNEECIEGLTTTKHMVQEHVEQCCSSKFLLKWITVMGPDTRDEAMIMTYHMSWIISFTSTRPYTRPFSNRISNIVPGPLAIPASYHIPVLA